MLRAKKILQFFSAALVVVATIMLSREASAQRMTSMGSKGTLAIDQLSGFRISSDGVGYAGPIGFAVQSFGETIGQAKSTTHTTTFWLAPSADYFLIDHLSLGGLFEVVTTSTSRDDQPTAGGTTITTQLPGRTSVSFIPRVGWLFAISDRFGIWPRGGIGYASLQRASSLNANIKDTLSGFLIDIDVGFLYRVTESWFLKAAPEVTFGLGPSHSYTQGNTTVSNDASFFRFAGVAGIGVMWDL